MKGVIIMSYQEENMKLNGGKQLSIYDDVVSEIKKTNNYGLFKNILGNRDLRGTNYNRLIQSMQKKQLVIPILCN